jgi:DNA-binding NarL/FixJ family response regulator
MIATRAMISVILADDHPVVLHGVAGILRAQSDMNILAACSDGAQAVEAIRKLTPDVAVLDVVMPGLNGLDLLAAMVGDGSKTRVIFLTAVATNDQILAAIANGAKGIVLKDAAPDTLVDCIRDVAAGKQWFPADLVEAAFRHNATRRNETERFESRLTAREQQIVLMVAEGLGNKEIARRIDLSEGTIKIHLHNIYEKLDVPNRTALTALAIAYQHRLRG